MESPNNSICQCCFNKTQKNLLHKCNHGHNLCQSCIRNFISVELAEGRTSTKCFAMLPTSEPCQAEIPHKTLQKVLGNEKVKQLVIQDSINAFQQTRDPDAFICAHCGFQFSLINRKQYRVKYCPVCNKGTCAKCGLKEHQGQTCQFASYAKQCAKDGIGFCPHCKLVYVKDKGCNMMKCPRCGIQFCSLCGVIIPPSVGYKHFSDAKKVPKGKCPLRPKQKRVLKPKAIELNDAKLIARFQNV